MLSTLVAIQGGMEKVYGNRRTGVILLVVLLLVLFAVKRWDQPVDQKVIKVDRWEEVKQYQYTKTPGLKRAEELDLVRTFDMKIPVPGTGRTLSIDEIWYNSNHVFFFTSIDVPSGFLGALPNEREVPIVSFVMGLPGDQQDGPGHPLFTLNWEPNEGVIYDGRFYNRATTNPLYKDGMTDILSKVDEIVLRDVSVSIGGQTIPLPDITLPIRFDVRQEVTVSVPLKQELHAMDRTITLESLELGTTVNRLYFRFRSPEPHEQLSHVSFTLHSEAGEVRDSNLSRIETGPNGQHYVEFEPFDKRPAKLELILHSLWLAGDDQIHFSIDSESYDRHLNNETDSYREKVAKHLATIKNTDVYLDELYYDDRGISFSIRYEHQEAEKLPRMHLIVGKPNDAEVGTNRKLPLTVTATNERGEPGEYGQSGSGENTYHMFLGAAFVQASKRIDVTVDRLLYEIAGEWKTACEVPKGE
ncbi:MULTISPECIES: hypothetical protein [Brevibacillus]|jgi:hypothetical protein|nr:MULTISPECIES: hypothetical protein [Bacillales]UFJ60582.1 hypothetical protein IRT44_15085 [Anoxybacillus sediminis]